MDRPDRVGRQQAADGDDSPVAGGQGPASAGHEVDRPEGGWFFDEPPAAEKADLVKIPWDQYRKKKKKRAGDEDNTVGFVPELTHIIVARRPNQYP